MRTFRPSFLSTQKLLPAYPPTRNNDNCGTALSLDEDILAVFSTVNLGRPDASNR